MRDVVRVNRGDVRAVLACLRRFAEYVLAQAPTNRVDPIGIEDGPVFATRKAAEWDLARRRWREQTGEIINQALHD